MSFKVVDWVQKAKPFKISDLLPFKLNAKEHPEEQIRGIVESIKKFGIYAPVVIDREMVIIAGHGRIEAAKRLGIDEFPCIQRDDLTDDEVSALRLIDNRIAETGWDASNLKTVLDKLDFDFEPFAVNFDEIVQELGADDELNDAEPQIDRAAELNEKWQVKSGDLWLIGEHRLLCGDSTKREDVGRLMGGEKADFCFTSPPYADMRDYSGGDMSVEKISSFIPAVADRCRFYAINLGLKRQDGEIQPYWNQYISKAKDSGLKLTAWNVWSRAGMGGSIGNMTAMFPIEHEWVFVFGGTRDDVRRTKINKSAGTHGKSTIRQRDGSTKKHDPGSVALKGKMGSVFTSCYASGGVDGHPAPFPLEFPAEYIKACSDEGGSIYDPFLGSGTTMVAAQNLNRRCFGMEISPNYCAVILERMSNSFPEIEIKRGE